MDEWKCRNTMLGYLEADKSPYESRGYYLECIKFATQYSDHLSLLVILQFMAVALDGECLLLAVKVDDAFAVRVLLHHGAPISYQNKSGETVDSLHEAFRQRKYAAAEEILKFLNYRSARLV
ncbi:unnamed protein product, partial [Gongylonema pulchrum]|uniref:ANK_REP_REGION domain-containing protein n=1 Tax=Gongylonema pulchrum TaxID=637853 RepID=A0A183EXY8_9BILA